MQEVAGLEYTRGASEKFLECMPSITSENALLASRAKTTFIIDLVPPLTFQLYIFH